MNTTCDLDVPTANGTSFFPSIVSARFHATWAFYTELLEFRTHREQDGFVHLVHPDGAQLGVLAEETDDAWPELVSAVCGRGLWLNLEVSDLDAVHQRATTAGVEILPPLRDSGGFTLRDPNGVLIRVAGRATGR